MYQMRSPYQRTQGFQVMEENYNGMTGGCVAKTRYSGKLSFISRTTEEFPSCSFGAAWYTGTCVPTTRKSAWTRQRLPPATRSELSGYAENAQKAEKGQKGPRDLRLGNLCFSYTCIFLRSAPTLLWLSSVRSF